MTPQPRPRPRPRSGRPGSSSWHQRARERATDAAAVLLTAGLLPLLFPAAATLEGPANPLPVPAGPAAESPSSPAGDASAGPADRFERGRLTLQPDPAGGPPLFVPRGVLGLAGERP